MKSYKVKLRSLTPYMQHRMDDKSLAEWEKLRHKIMERPEVSQLDATRAEYHCYRNAAEQCYIPADQIRGSLILAGSYIKAKVGALSKSMKTMVAATFIVSPEEILLPDYDVIDKRSAVNKNVKARVIVVRPKWTTWEAEFTLNVFEDSLTDETIERLFQYAGSYVGIGSFRPTNSGLFGRYELVEMNKI